MSRAPIGFEAIGLAVSPYDLLQRQAQLWPDHALLVLPEAVGQLWGLDRLVWTYREVLAEVDRLAAGYAAAGYGVGNRVALLFENRPQHFLHWFALNSPGVSIVPLNPDYRADELRYALTHSAACLIVTVPTCLARLETVAAEMEFRSGSMGRCRPPLRQSARLRGRWTRWNAFWPIPPTPRASPRAASCPTAIS